MEILAPAGSPELLYAAIAAGADAVYLGGEFFSARKFAGNFDNLQMKEAVHLCHSRGIAVYVTLNTLISDNEIDKVKEYLRFLDSIYIDGLLIQDLGIAYLANKITPNIPLHASTQMTVSNLAGVQFLESLNFKRVVLSRELSLDEIEYIANNCRAEIEIFVHGALCVSYSGQCLMSSFIGGRSGNRGACAQPCRMPYHLTDDMGRPIKKESGRYIISLKDMSGIQDIETIKKSKVVSLKIEGRMKSPEYVYDVVSSYRKALDQDCCTGMEETSQLQKKLEKRFYRGFTSAYYHDDIGADMMTSIIPGNRGIMAGTIEKINQYSFLFKNIVNISQEHITGVSYVTSDYKIAFISEKNINKVNGNIYQCLMQKKPLDKSHIYWHIKERKYNINREKLQGKTIIDFSVFAAVGSPLTLIASDRNNHSITIRSSYQCEKANKHVASLKDVKEQLMRLGGTPFLLGDLKLKNKECMIPKSILNTLRKEAVHHLSNCIEKDFVKSTHNFSDKIIPLPNIQTTTFSMKPEISIRTEQIEQVKSALKAGCKEIIFGGDSYHHQVLSVSKYKEALELVKNANGRIIFATPRVLREKHSKEYLLLLSDIAKLKPDAIEVSFLGILNWYNKYIKDIPLVGGSSLNIFNKEGLNTIARLGMSGVMLSPELTIKQIAYMTTNTTIPIGITAFGRSEMMISDYCVIESVITGDKKKKCPGICLHHHYNLKDEQGRLFPIRTDEWCRMHILNSKVLDMRPYMNKLIQAGVHRIHIDARAIEGDIYKITRSFVDILSGDAPLPKVDSNATITRGHFFRGVL